MAVHAKLYQPIPSSRQADRRALDLTGTLRDVQGIPIDVEIRDLSVSGVRMLCTESLEIGAEVWLGLPGMGRQVLTVLRRDGDEYGCRFENPLQPADIEKVGSVKTLVEGVFASSLPVPLAPLPIDEDAKWPGRTRLAFLVGASGVLWAGIFAGAWALLR